MIVSSCHVKGAIEAYEPNMRNDYTQFTIRRRQLAESQLIQSS